MSKADRDIIVRDPSSNQITLREICQSVDSLKDVTGKLILRSNPHYFYKATRRRARLYGTASVASNLTGVDGVYFPPQGSDPQTYQKAYASLVKKVHSGSASLGVTGYSWRQSSEMIIKRLQDPVRLLKKVTTPQEARRLEKAMQFRPTGDLQNLSTKAANTHLEWIFGWVPLFTDIHDAISVWGSEPPPAFISGQGRGNFLHNRFINGELTVGEYNRRVRLSAHIKVTNPNLWMANRLGLVNPATVIWDVIPWSFVVGMFVSINQYIKSFTDWVGLELVGYSRTNSEKGYLTRTYSSYPVRSQQNASLNPNRGEIEVVWRRKERILGTSPERPPLIWRVPEMNLGLLLMSTALAVQQATRVQGLLLKAGQAAAKRVI